MTAGSTHTGPTPARTGRIRADPSKVRARCGDLPNRQNEFAGACPRLAIAKTLPVDCPLGVHKAGLVGPQDAGDSGLSTMGTGPVPYRSFTRRDQGERGRSAGRAGFAGAKWASEVGCVYGVPRPFRKTRTVCKSAMVLVPTR